MDTQQRSYTEWLVLRCQQGEAEAFELLVRLWQEPLLLFAWRYLGQEADARDAVQETWVAAMKGLNRLQHPSLFVSWLFRMMTNKCIDQLRRRQLEQRHLAQVDSRTEASDPSQENPSLRQAIRRLPNEHKILVLLRFEQGLQIGQIAAVLNLPEGTVKSRLHRALAQLRDNLGKTYDSLET